MLKSVFKIGLYSQEEKDFTLFGNLSQSISNLNITFRLLLPGKIISVEEKFSEIPIYVIHSSLFEDPAFESTLKEIGKSTAPVLCVLDNSSLGQTQKALDYPCDFWLFRDSVNEAILESILKRAEQIYRLKEQAFYLRKKFHESEKRFISVFRSKSEAVIVLSSNNLIRFINPACDKQFGIKRSLIGQQFPYSLKAGNITEIDLKPLSGKKQIVEVVVSELIWEDELCLTVTLSDISEKKRVEDEMITFRHVIHLSPLPIMITNSKGNILYINEQFEKSTGYTSEDIIGKTPNILKSGKHDNQFYKHLWGTINSNNTWRGQICNKAKNGKLYWEKQLISPVNDKNGNINFFVSIRIDDLEKRKKEQKMHEAKTLQSVQELAGGIAHEFSQPLQVLSISMALMEKDMGDSEYFLKANKMIKRIILLVDNLKSITALRQQDYLSSKILDIKASSEKTMTNNMKPRILVIDDEIEVLNSLIDLLTLSGYTCDGVTNGPEALDRLGRNPYRLIISDIDMPGMGGTELLKRIKETDYDGYFVFMTGYEIDDDLEEDIKMADAFLTKPFELKNLKDLVDKIFKENQITQ
ncbi:MAG: PAS domain S-box protein [Calditrichaeota bacterium]|nr:MAG: PAS domain S-box protein [Calditrichota bacterium]MBL1204394.1 PAS domain S-box protein [Calditrichota bacterium]NOG44223.1 PAS domain S-box protein [Calditrichota bacterium]